MNQKFEITARRGNDRFKEIVLGENQGFALIKKLAREGWTDFGAREVIKDTEVKDSGIS